MALRVLAPPFQSYSASNASARWSRPPGGAVFYGSSRCSPGPLPQATESTPTPAVPSHAIVATLFPVTTH